ncbi:MAG: ABC transporter permease [Patescibacteria group bacterium]
MWYEAFKTARKSLWSNKTRSFLTLLGMVIGIYAVVTLLSLAQGIQGQIASQVEGLGPRAIFVLPGETEEGSSTPNFTAQFAPSTIFVDDVGYLQDHATTIEDQIDYAVILGGVLRHGENKATVLPMGVTPGLLENLGLKNLKSGRAMTAADVTNNEMVIFITTASAQKLSASVGETIQLGVDKFTLAGIYAVPENAGLSFGDSQNMAIVPATIASEINQSNQVSRILVQAKDIDSVNASKTEVVNLLTEKHGTEDFTVLLSSDLLNSVTQITDVLKYAVVGIAAISLLVGGIGISNIMLVTVTERTREIGIRKAVGATEWAIMLQFLIESIMLTIIGALIGLGLAWGTTVLVAKFTPLEPALTNSTIMLAVGMGAITGIIFGLFPAFRAARKHPVRALRYE